VHGINSSAEFSRIWDHELVAAVMKIAGNGAGETRWKVPGMLDWSSMTHNPFVDVTTDTTTLYASDRDMFLFLSMTPTRSRREGCRMDHRICIFGDLALEQRRRQQDAPDCEFLLRAVCMNRNLWGVENFEEITIRHSKVAAQRFAHEAARLR
jgi:hypothetical protein